jgi:hypothetical protein
VCRLAGAIAATCDAPSAVELYVAGDYDLYTSLQKHGPALVQLEKEVTQLEKPVQDVSGTTTGDFQAIGVVHDNAFQCVDEASATFTTAQKSFANCISVLNIIHGVSF